VGTFLGGSILAPLLDHHPFLSLGNLLSTLGTVLALGVIVTGLRAVWRRRDRQRIFEHVLSGRPAVELLNGCWLETQGWLAEPPGRETYERWLIAVHERLVGVSPSLAAEWGVPDEAPQSDPMSWAVISERRERIKAMHRRVASQGLALEELAAAGVLGADIALSARAGLVGDRA
jgi:hypothetical protein